LTASPGLHSSEHKLDAISGLNILHLRAAYFMENNLAAIGMIQGMGIFGHALLPDLKLPMAATRDVGGYAARRLLNLDFSGKQTRELLGERDLSMTEAAALIARGIGKLDLRYVQFPSEQVQKMTGGENAFRPTQRGKHRPEAGVIAASVRLSKDEK
jgi:uncharacterized protein YbjT (DUF2867 family)